MNGLRFVFFVSALFLLISCGEESPSGAISFNRGVTDDEIILGSFSDLSGPVAVWGVGSINGARMRFSEVNKVGGIHGRQIRLVVEDTSYQVPKAISAANKLINRDDVLAMLLGVGTPMNNALMPILFEAGVPNLFPISGGRQMVEPFHKLKFSQHYILPSKISFYLILYTNYSIYL